MRSGDVTGLDLHQVVDDGVDMPARKIGRARQNGRKALRTKKRRSLNRPVGCLFFKRGSDLGLLIFGLVW
jgi:hypothetical protein